MKRTTFIVFLIIFFFNSNILLFSKKNELHVEQSQIQTTKQVRILLAEYNIESDKKFIIKSAKGFVLKSSLHSHDKALYKKDEIHILCKNKKLFLLCSDDRYRHIKYSSIEMVPVNQECVWGEKAYKGSFIFVIDQILGKVFIINKLALEDYVCSVIHTEIYPSWSIGMQKVQAIISRSYAIFVMQQIASQNKVLHHYDLKNTNHHQTYRGTHSFDHLRKAVEDTKDIIVTYKGNVALTMFDGCCSGSNPSLMRYKDISKPYLIRSQRCFFCQKSPSYQWKLDMNHKTFLKELKSHAVVGKKIKKFGNEIVAVVMKDIDKAGLLHAIKLFDEHNRPLLITGNDVRAVFPKKVRSLSFEIKKIRDRIVITGKGFGHQRGLCQWGAKELITRGWEIKKIIQFYYPGVNLSRLK